MIWKRLFLLITILVYVQCSPGDNLDSFIDCTDTCEIKRKCPNSEAARWADVEKSRFKNHNFDETPFLLSTFFFWDCISDCDYQCQQIVTKLRIKKKQKIFQFHGKWPFKRLFTFQEMFSTIFSMGNFFPHYHGYRKLNEAITYNRFTGKDTRGLLHLRNYSYVAIAGMFAWSASTIFHWRDLLITEKMDYFFAGMTVLMGFHAIFSRFFRLDRYPTIAKGFFWTVAGIFTLHILRLYLDWSYTYNMRFNVCFGLLQYILLIAVSYQNYKILTKDKKSPTAYLPSRDLKFKLCATPIIMVTSTAMAMSLELFDHFSWNWQIDSHAMWHFCTIWPSWILYDFFLNDYNYFITKENVD
ncbi:hypothetical protein Kpol_2000p74 [Vanderwaltozyma polyspora DSM 70294]|uniref:Post-GPI attachment to proteins factor 3 n=1 Tax=Vanderwaltozyma polyspora (strain ATCC 22028 / DSM 70294 / BCRC 21397 / CBS 2163 / NBRC 10782 / NRRL Y-8283 / UCD 57-17) TaxID=436907 RepID=A7TF81_VANPO|nr:uncharacterized protein Kpol_2000p74 [Vanderwaltozyma polyspora DSM 70294]EDO19106.1 hypothetical protein Kpol_2000p74 [Vanderwaltozyma polyspora DSM 70294]